MEYLNEIFSNFGSVEHGIKGRHFIHSNALGPHEASNFVHGR